MKVVDSIKKVLFRVEYTWKMLIISIVVSRSQDA